MLESLFHAYAETGLSLAIRESRWAFAMIEIVHLLAMALFGGALVIGGLGAAGWGFAFAGRQNVWRGVRTTLLFALAGAAASGALLVGSNPLKYYYNDAFRWKEILIFLGLLALVWVDKLVIFSSPTALRGTRLFVLLSLTLWLGVGFAGRLIGLL